MKRDRRTPARPTQTAAPAPPPDAAPAGLPLLCMSEPCTKPRVRRAGWQHVPRANWQHVPLCGDHLRLLPPPLQRLVMDPQRGVQLDQVAIRALQTVQAGGYPCFRCGAPLAQRAQVSCDGLHEAREVADRWVLWNGLSPDVASYLTNAEAPFVWSTDASEARLFTKPEADALLATNWPGMDQLFAAVPAAVFLG